MSKQKSLREWSSTERLPEGFAKWLKEIITQQETEHRKGFRQIATELGVDPALLSRWIAGAGPLNEESIRALVANLGPVVYIYLGMPRPNNPHRNKNSVEKSNSAVKREKLGLRIPM